MFFVFVGVRLHGVTESIMDELQEADVRVLVFNEGDARYIALSPVITMDGQNGNSVSDFPDVHLTINDEFQAEEILEKVKGTGLRVDSPRLHACVEWNM